MKTILREWLFPVAVMLTWGVGFTYTLVRLGEAHRTHAEAAIVRALPQPAPASHLLASAK
jgi:hypothetical protein